MHSSPAIANGVVYVGSADSKVYAFDVAGILNCSGTPKTCAPLWTGGAGVNGVYSSPTIVDGTLYVGAYPYLDQYPGLFAFDAAGVTNCSTTTPKTCFPICTANTGTTYSSPAVVDGTVYVGGGDAKLSAFNASRSGACTGVLQTCPPLWTAAVDAPAHSSPAVVDGTVVVTARGSPAGAPARSTPSPRLRAPDARGRPRPVVPFGRQTWTRLVLTRRRESHRVGCGASTVPARSLSASMSTGSPDAAELPSSASRCGRPAPSQRMNRATRHRHSVANNVVYLATAGGDLYAFDAHGVENCAGAPKTCAPLLTLPVGGPILSSPAIAGGRIYVGSNDHKLHVLGLPAA